MQEKEMSKISLLSQVGSLIYNFGSEKKVSIEEKLPLLKDAYPYPAPVNNKRYCSKKGK